MIKAIKTMFGSKKFLASLCGVVVAVAAEAGLNISTEALVAVMSPIVAYILGQGVADHGKERPVSNG